MKRKIIGLDSVVLVLCMYLLAGCALQNATPVASSEAGQSESTASEVTSGDASTEILEPKETKVSGEEVETAAQAYAAFIEKQVKTGELFGESAAMAMIHVDDDAIPELVIIPQGAHADAVYIYSFNGQNVTELGAYGGFGSCYYERGKGILYGTYTGQGETFDKVGIVNGGKPEDVCIVSCVDLSFVPPFDEKGYQFFSGDYENRVEITEEEYREMLTPYLTNRRTYKVLSYDDGLLPYYIQIDNVEEMLLHTLDMEDNYPEADLNEILNGSRVFPL